MDLGVILSPDRVAAMEARGDWAGKTTLDYLDAAVAKYPDRAALIAHDSETGTDTTLTYAELDAVARRIALGLLSSASRPATWSPSSFRTGGSSRRCISPASMSARSATR